MTLWTTARFDDGPVKMGPPLTITYRRRKRNWFVALLLKIWRKLC